MLLTVFEQTQRMVVIARKGHMLWPQASEVNIRLQKKCSHVCSVHSVGIIKIHYHLQL